MSSARAVQQIGTLLTQAGVPPGIALDISQRLLTATGAGKRVINSNDARSPAFFNRYRAPEQNPKPTIDERALRDGISGEDGKDGIIAYYERDGRDGRDGADGVVDYDKIRDMIEQIIREYWNGGGGVVNISVINQINADLRKVWQAIRELQKRVDALVADVATIKKTLKDHGDRIKKIEDALKNTIECPKVIP